MKSIRLQSAKITVDAGMAIKSFVQENLDAGEVVALVSLDIQRAFDAAWWPGGTERTERV